MLVNNNNNPTNVTVKSENKKDLQIKYWKSNANCKFHRTNKAKRRKAQEKPAKDCANQRWKIRNTSEKYLNKSNLQWKIRKCEVGTPLKAHKSHCLALSEVKAKCVKNNWQRIKKSVKCKAKIKSDEKNDVCVCTTRSAKRMHGSEGCYTWSAIVACGCDGWSGWYVAENPLFSLWLSGQN